MRPKATYGLIGKKLSHSFSQKYFTEKFKQLGLDNSYQYLLFEVENVNEVKNIVNKYPNLKGLNVTIPFKSDILELADEVSEEVKIIGAANTIKIIKSKNNIKLKAYNTDIVGFRLSIAPFIFKKKKQKALILGSGGASKAVQYVLSQENISYQIVSRIAENNKISYQDLNAEILNASDFIINTTPLGMYPDLEQFPAIPYHFIKQNHIAIDLIYNPSETLFLKKCKEKTANCINGNLMLITQAEAAWEIWCGK